MHHLHVVTYYLVGTVSHCLTRSEPPMQSMQRWNRLFSSSMRVELHTALVQTSVGAARRGWITIDRIDLENQMTVGAHNWYYSNT